MLYFELGYKESTNVPIWIIAGFQQGNRHDSQDLNFDGFWRLPVVSAQFIIGKKCYPNAAK